MKILFLLAFLVIILSIGLSACGPKPDGGSEIPIKMEYGRIDTSLFSLSSIRFDTSPLNSNRMQTNADKA